MDRESASSRAALKRGLFSALPDGAPQGHFAFVPPKSWADTPSAPSGQDFRVTQRWKHAPSKTMQIVPTIVATQARGARVGCTRSEAVEGISRCWRWRLSCDSGAGERARRARRERADRSIRSKLCARFRDTAEPSRAAAKCHRRPPDLDGRRLVKSRSPSADDIEFVRAAFETIRELARSPLQAGDLVRRQLDFLNFAASSNPLVASPAL
jgi:hypothetical protein